MLADLVAEFAESPEEVERGDEPVEGRLVGVASVQGLRYWQLYVDGAANQRGSGVGLVLVSPEKITIEKSFRLISPLRITRPSMKLYCRGCRWCKTGEKGSKSFFGLKIGCRTSRR